MLNQATLPDVDEKEIEKLGQKLNTTKKEWESHNEEVKDLNSILKDLNSQLTNEEIVVEIKKYEKMVLKSDQNLSSLSLLISQRNWKYMKVETIRKFRMKKLKMRRTRRKKWKYIIKIIE